MNVSSVKRSEVDVTMVERPPKSVVVQVCVASETAGKVNANSDNHELNVEAIAGSL